MCLVAFGETADRRDMVPAEGGVRGQALRHKYIQKGCERDGRIRHTTGKVIK